MTEIEVAQLEALKRRLSGPEQARYSDALLLGYLDDAQAVIISRRYPFGCTTKEASEVEPVYRNLQVRIALELLSKAGAEGQTAHTENGTSRTYESAGVSSSLLSEITPKVKVL